jgi:hypothetical protein
MMRLSRLVTLALLASCARNPETGARETRVRDTTTDTLDHARAIPDTAGGLDTTSRR